MTSDSHASPSPSGGGSTTPEDAFDEFLRLVDEGRDVDFETFCGRYPDVADELRTLRSHWERMAGVVDDLATSLGDDSDGSFDGGGSASLDDADITAAAHTNGTASPASQGPATTPDSRSHASRADGHGPTPTDHSRETADEQEGETSTSDASGAAGIIDRLQTAPSVASRYAQRGEIARGGMGSIVRVWDGDLRRTLAMKIMLDKPSARARQGRSKKAKASAERQIGRFLEEAQITGQLDHPGIVPVHELGVDPDGRLFFTMRLVRGRSLRTIFELVHDGKEHWNIARALGVLQRVCEALAYAHSKHVIHRDIKPANVMVGRFGETYVMDWGLAKVMGHEDLHDIRPRSEADPTGTDATLSRVHSDRKDAGDRDPDSPLMTMDGAVVGTPAYMSPEQAKGQVELIGPATDIYAVGALLYHLVSGQMPYVDSDERVSPYTILNAVRTAPPRPLHQVAPQVPPELVAICSKAMARRHEDRYETMIHMSRDLRSFLEGRVVKAYEAGAIAELRKWVRRNRMTAALFVLLIGSLIVGLLIVADQANQSELAARQAMESESRAKDATRVAETTASLLTESEDEARRLAEEADRRRYATSILLAEMMLRDEQPDLAAQRLDAAPEHLRGWEWEHLELVSDPSLAVYDDHLGRVSAVAFDPRGDHLATGSWEDGVRIRSLDGDGRDTRLDLGTAGVSALAYHPRQPLLAVGTFDRFFATWNPESGERLAGGPDAGWAQLPDVVADLTFAPDGLLFIASGQLLYAADVALETKWTYPRFHRQRLTAVADGGVVATAAGDRLVVLWDTLLGELIDPLGLDSVPLSLAFDDTGLRLAAGTENGTIEVFDLGPEAHEPFTLRTGRGEPIHALGFGPGGRLLVSASEDGTLSLWNLEATDDATTLLGHDDAVVAAAVAPDGRRIASASFDGTARVWDATWRNGLTFIEHPGSVTSLALSPDGDRIVTAGQDSRLRLFETRTHIPLVEADLVQEGAWEVAYSPDGRWVAAGAAGSLGQASYPIQLWEITAAGELVEAYPLSAHDKLIEDIAFAPDGRLLASASQDHDVRLWSTSDGSSVGTLSGHDAWVRSVAFHPHEPWLASGSLDRTVRLWDLRDLQTFEVLADHDGFVSDIAFNPAGTRLATASADGGIRVYACDDWTVRRELEMHGEPVALDFHPDGVRLAVSSKDKSIQVWDTEHGDLLLDLRTDVVSEELEFSADGKRLFATAGTGVDVYETEPPATTFAERQARMAVREQALAHFRDLLDRSPDPRDVLEILERDRALDPAVRADALALVRNFGDSSWSLVKRARGLMRVDTSWDDWKDALRMARAADVATPDDTDVLSALALAQARCEPHRALDTLARLERLDPSLWRSPEPQVALAWTQAALARDAAASQTLAGLPPDMEERLDALAWEVRRIVGLTAP